MGAAWTLHVDDGVAELTFDLAGEKVNVLRQDNMDELAQHLQHLKEREGIRALLVRSGKDGFIAGADIHSIANVESAVQASQAARRGQEVFGRLASLPFPTVALIHGACVGGGLELALACRSRVASDAASTKLGLPEVMLGILPGFGGTQRLPRTVGLLFALPLLLTGKQVDGRGALKIGLVDAVGPPAALRQLAMKVARGQIPRPRRPLMTRFLDALLRTQGWIRRRALDAARRQIEARTGHSFPAPYAILEAVEASYTGRGEDGFEKEAQLLGELLNGSVSRNLVRLFLMAEAAREGDMESGVRRATVAGAGTMGAGIVAALVTRDVRTRMMDPVPDGLARGMQTLRGQFQKKNRRRRDRETENRRLLDLVEPTLTLTGLSQQDLFLEAVPEKLELKQAVLSEAEASLPASALLATNTSSLSLDAIADRLTSPERLVGIHFFNPVHRMRLVEVVRGSSTDPACVQRAVALVRELGKVPVVVENAPGFLVNRLLTPYLMQAERLVSEGAPIAAIDRAMVEAGMPMGPLRLLDEVGLDVADFVAEVMARAFPDRFEPVGLVRKLRSQGALGKKNSRGFYLHGKRSEPNPAAGTPVPSSGTPEEWRDRLVLPVIAEAYRCLDEGIVQSQDDVDLAMLLGTGFLLPTGGPLQYARQRGLDSIVAALQRLEPRHGKAFAVPEGLLRQVTTTKDQEPCKS